MTLTYETSNGKVITRKVIQKDEGSYVTCDNKPRVYFDIFGIALYGSRGGRRPRKYGYWIEIN